MILYNARELHQAEHYDAFHAARAASPLVSQLYARAMGEAYPAEVAPNSSCDWPLLGALIGLLKLRPDQVLADIGCGTGGVGLWLARALNARLAGIDVSATAIRLATQRRATFLPAERAHFTVGSLEHTGLPDAQIHALICVDALFNAEDRLAALTEFHRVLAPGGRAVLTRTLPPGGHAEITAQAQAAGLTAEHIDTRPDEPQMWQRLYQYWIDHEDGLRAELGHDQTDNMLTEAHRMLPRLSSRQALIVTLRRPAPSRREQLKALGSAETTEGETAT